MLNKKLFTAAFIVCLAFSAWQWISAEANSIKAKNEMLKGNMGITQEIIGQTEDYVANRYNLAFQRIILFDGLVFALFFLILRRSKND